MRTTVEIPDGFRARLLEIAGRRGQKGFSGLISEALEVYLNNDRESETAVAAALSVRGSLSGLDGDALRAETEAIRADWR